MSLQCIALYSVVRTYISDLVSFSSLSGLQCIPVLGGGGAGNDSERWEGETAETECHHGGPGRNRSQGEHWEISEGGRVAGWDE